MKWVLLNLFIQVAAEYRQKLFRPKISAQIYRAIYGDRYKVFLHILTIFQLYKKFHEKVKLTELRKCVELITPTNANKQKFENSKFGKSNF